MDRRRISSTINLPKISFEALCLERANLLKHRLLATNTLNGYEYDWKAFSRGCENGPAWSRFRAKTETIIALRPLELCNLVDALNIWLKTGGFYPERWDDELLG
jgi:hypothetical protein